MLEAKFEDDPLSLHQYYFREDVREFPDKHERNSCVPNVN